MQTRYSDENSVRLSVRLSNAWFVTKRKNDVSRFMYHTKDNLAKFSYKKNGWWGTTPSIWNFGLTGPRWSEIADLEQIIARSASAVTPSEKSSINTNMKSTTRFPVSLRWSSYIAPHWPNYAAKMTGRGRPRLLEILGQTDRVGTKSPIFDLFSISAPQR